MADEQARNDQNSLLLVARNGELGEDMGRIVCMTHPKARRVQEGLQNFEDHEGVPITIGAWKGPRSS